MDYIAAIIMETWAVLFESSPYMIFGLAAAGLLKAFLPEAFIARHLSRASTSSVFKAAFIGAPLPL